LLIVIAGPGGVGKDTVAQKLCEQDPRFVISRSWTTRQRRPGEAADAYVFATRREFEDRVAANGFLEWAEYHGNLYGTPTPDPDDDRHLILVIETQGAANILERFPETVAVIIRPPSAEVLLARLRARGDDDEHVKRRLEAAAHELDAGAALTDLYVVNDDLNQAVEDLGRILEGRLSGGTTR
jgi:guanylate kinase